MTVLSVSSTMKNRKDTTTTTTLTTTRSSPSSAVGAKSSPVGPSTGTTVRARMGSYYSYKMLLLMIGTIMYLPMWIHSHWKSYLHFTETHPFDISSMMSDTNSQLEFFKAGMTNGMAGTFGRRGLFNDDRQSLLEDRISFLEQKLNSYLAFSSDPFLAQKTPAQCKEQKVIKDLGCPDKTLPCELDDQVVCMDDFKEPPTSVVAATKASGTPPCLVYDFGIRKSPEFGLAFSGQPFNCEVVGFDPSPISERWWKDQGSAITQKYPTYKFLPVGAGGQDGDTRLLQYDWGQVSIIEFPTHIVDVTNCTDGACRYIKHQPQKEFHIPVKTLPTLVKELGHTNRRITVLKLDVEGSEYALLEHLIENDPSLCRRVDQITLEWHHYDYDLRYGVGSNPQLNVIVKLLDYRCGLQQFWIHSKGWPSNNKLYQDFGMTLYYNLASFKRTRWWDDDGNELPSPPVQAQ
jgi:FkbM family methyltransferase